MVAQITLPRLLKMGGGAIAELVRQGWGQDNPAFRQMFTSQMMPGATAEQMNWFNELQRMTTSPEIAARLRVSIGEIDVMSLLPQVSTPTLVLHARGDAVAPFDGGRKMASMERKYHERVRKMAHSAPVFGELGRICAARFRPSIRNFGPWTADSGTRPLLSWTFVRGECPSMRRLPSQAGLRQHCRKSGRTDRATGDRIILKYLVDRKGHNC